VFFNILFFNILAQDIRFNVNPTYSRSLKKSEMQNVKTMADIQKDYPKNWISDYKYVVVSGTVNGKSKAALSQNDTLNSAQISLMKNADMGSELEFEVKYGGTNTVTEKKVTLWMKYNLTIVPEKEAEFEGGIGLLTKYILEAAINKIPRSKNESLMNGFIIFTVNESGEISEASIKNSSSDAETDELLLKAIQAMPKWTPAQDINGKKIKQSFQLSFGNSNGC
jgi:TonB family protein